MGETVTNYKITATYQEALSAFERINAEIGEGATTIAGMTDKAAKLNKEFKQTKVGSEAFEFLGQQTKKANAELSAMVGTTARFNMVGINTARLFSDMGYFANSASMGIMAIGNNISPLIESFQMAKTEGKSFGDVLKGAFSGYGGWLIGINILVSAITAYSIASSKAKTDTDDLTKSVGLLKKQFDELVRIENPFEKIFFPIKSGDLQRVLSNVRDQLKQQKTLISETVETILQQPRMVGKVWTTDPKAVQEELARRGDRYAEPLYRMMQQETALQGLIDKLKASVAETKSLELATNALTQSGLTPQIEGAKENTKALKEQAETMGFLTALYGDYIDKIQKAMLIQISARKEARGLKEFGIAGEVAVPNRPDMQATQKEIEELQDKRVAEITKRYNNVFNSASKIGNLLQRSFDKAGTGFISQLNEALQIVVQIADIMETVGLIKSIVAGATAVATGGTSVIPSIIASGIAPSRQQAPTVINVQLGNATVARVVAQGQQMAQELRY